MTGVDAKGGGMLRAAEFFSGVGGLRFALRRSNVNGDVIAHFENNPHCNKCYKHNFGDSPRHTNIEHLDAAMLDKLDADIFLMSPPCQPYTCSGLQKDIDDNRSNAFVHLLSLISTMSKRPRYLLLENVKNFETSRTGHLALNTLEEAGYTFRQFILSPVQFAIPNERIRYFLLAKLHPLAFDDGWSGFEREVVLSHIPGDRLFDNRPFIYRLSNSSSESSLGFPKSIELDPTAAPPPSISQTKLKTCLEEDVDMDIYRVPDTTLLKASGYRFDIVRPESVRSSCFTKGYSQYTRGTGSILQTNFDRKFSVDFDDPSSTMALHLRYLTPRELANLHGLPADFEFPKEVNLKQRYRMLGNGLNVVVVSHLLDFLFRDPLT